MLHTKLFLEAPNLTIYILLKYYKCLEKKIKFNDSQISLLVFWGSKVWSYVLNS